MFGKNKKLNFCTIRVFTFITCDNLLIGIAKKCETYKDFTDELIHFCVTSTSDNVSLSDIDLDYDFLDKLIRNLR